MHIDYINLMKCRRNSCDISAVILEAAIGGATKSKMMYEAFVSFTHLKPYLASLRERGLIVCDESEQIYRTTEKGQKYITIYHTLSACVNEAEYHRQRPFRALLV